MVHLSIMGKGKQIFRFCLLLFCNNQLIDSQSLNFETESLSVFSKISKRSLQIYSGSQVVKGQAKEWNRAGDSVDLSNLAQTRYISAVVQISFLKFPSVRPYLLAFVLN